MKFSNCLKLAMVVGLAASAASAGDRVVTKLQGTAGITPVYKGVIDFNTGVLSQYGTRSNTSSAFDNMTAGVDGTPSIIDVSDNSDGWDFFFYSGLAGDAGDPMTLDRRAGGRGIYGDRVMGTVSTLDWGVIYVGDGSSDTVLVDDYHIFWNDLIEWDAADLLRGSFIGGFYFGDLEIPDVTATGSFFIYSAVGLDGLVNLSDNYIVYEHITSFTGSGGTPAQDPSGGQIFNGDGTPSGMDGSNYLGESGDLFMYDADGSLGYNDNEWLYYFGGSPFVANILLNIGVQSCDADFDGSGFVDLDDFNGFVPAFEAGC